MNDNEALRKDILVRLRKIEGQVKGIQGMVEKDVCCREVLVIYLLMQVSLILCLSQMSL